MWHFYLHDPSGNSEEEESNRPTQEIKLQQKQEDIEKQQFECKGEISANEGQQKQNTEHSKEVLDATPSDQVDGATSFDKNVVGAEPVEQKDIDSPKPETIQLIEIDDTEPAPQDDSEQQIVNKQDDSFQVIEVTQAMDKLAQEVEINEAMVVVEVAQSQKMEEIEKVEIKPTSQEPLEEQIFDKDVDSIQVNETGNEKDEKATEVDTLAREVTINESVVVPSKTDIQQDLDTPDVDSEDVSNKSKVTAGGGKKKKRKKRGKKKGANSENQKGQENPTRSDKSTAVDGKSMKQKDGSLTDQQSQQAFTKIRRNASMLTW
ncbi:hypothetical protein WMY93_001717 [Mugilogobius chulae]|uniref:Uncharacterized protein n=1 Tax=Mugilogobius chulae TaxID=88201 RepID=A0AAW0Q6J7_9GOBI